jgi:hypothetical protein
MNTIWSGLTKIPDEFKLLSKAEREAVKTKRGVERFVTRGARHDPKKEPPT